VEMCYEFWGTVVTLSPKPHKRRLCDPGHLAI
jgi:hypothetical protein